MNKKILCALPLSFLVVACGGQQGVKTAPSCEQRTPKKVCSPNRDPSGTPFVNVTPNGWVVAPLNVCVTAGDKLEIRFLGPAPALDTIGTSPKGNTEFWLIGKNDSDEKKITLTVPPGPAADKSFDYYILSDKKGCVDPRVTYE